MKNRPTPKDKAKELITKYNSIVIEIVQGDMYEQDIIDRNMDINSAKQCALLCVEELIHESTITGNFITKPFWEAVKKEIYII